MKAAVISHFGGPENLVFEEVPVPTPTPNQILIKVKAFGINRAEIYMRKGDWGEVAKISGIECVGEVEFDPSSTINRGQTVVALMGGMGRTINGSYAQYTAVPSSNVIPVDTELSWTDLAAIPESYATAWHCLVQNLKITTNQTLLVRGGTSALGLAAINIAKQIKGVKVIATTRFEHKLDALRSLNVDYALIDNGHLEQQVRAVTPAGVNATLDLIGNSTLLDSIKTVSSEGYVCNAGFLGGGEPVLFNPITDLPSGVNLNFFASFMFGNDGFPLSKIPIQEIINCVENGIYKARPSKAFRFENLPKAHELMEENQANGKIVVTIDH